MTITSRAINFECPLSIHMALAGEITKLVDKYDAVLTIGKNGNFSSTTNLMHMISLGIRSGDKIRLTAVGSDADKMLDAFRIMLLTYSEQLFRNSPTEAGAGFAIAG